MRALAFALLFSPALLSAQSAAQMRDPTAIADRQLTAREHSHTHSSPDQFRAEMLRLIGPLPERTPLNPVVLGETALPGMRIQKLLFDSQPGFHVTALLYLPEATLLPTGFPAIVMAPGHSPAGKAGDFAQAAAFVRNGFAVLSYDPLGQGERLQYPSPADPQKSLAKGPTGEHGEASLQPALIGESIAQYFLWDGIRAIDYLETRPEIDKSRIGAFGCSGGGAMTALLGAVDQRVRAIGTACYITSFSTLLHTIGPQDGEQSTPGWIAGGLDFASYVEAAAPRPYAIIATEGDMFPFAGAQAAEKEARAFYKAQGAESMLAFITGPGGHGNLKPILPRILKFFIDALQPAPFAPVYDDQSPALQPPPGALQVTPTGQVSTFDPRSETVYSLTLKRAEALRLGHPASRPALRAAILKATGEQAALAGRKLTDDGLEGYSGPVTTTVEGLRFGSREVVSGAVETADATRWQVALPRPDGTVLHGSLTLPKGIVAPPLHLLVSSLASREADAAVMSTAVAAGRLVLQVFPGPDDPNLPGKKTLRLVGDHAVYDPDPRQPGVDIKAPVLGPWYLPGLRYQLVGRTILGERMEDILLAVDYLAQLRLVHPAGLTAEATGHLALVLLHAAALDGRITQTSLRELPKSYAQVLRDPLPRDEPEDLLPGVLLLYDVPDLLRPNVRLDSSAARVHRP